MSAVAPEVSRTVVCLDCMIDRSEQQSDYEETSIRMVSENASMELVELAFPSDRCYSAIILADVIVRIVDKITRCFVYLAIDMIWYSISR